MNQRPLKEFTEVEHLAHLADVRAILHGKESLSSPKVSPIPAPVEEPEALECSKCKERKPPDCFYIANAKSRRYRRGKCIACCRKYDQEVYARKREKNARTI